MTVATPLAGTVEGGSDPGTKQAKATHTPPRSKLLSAMLNAVTEKDIQAVVEALVRQAKDGSVPAAEELLERILGPPVAADIVERLEALEQLAAEHHEGAV